MSRRQPNPTTEFEVQFQSEGFQNIAGVDEAGRGCLAGPVVAACVILPWQEDFSGIKDSKMLNAGQREACYEIIVQRAFAFGIGMVEAPQIDRINILQASLAAMRIAMESLKIKPDLLLVDGNQKIPALTLPQKCIINGDALSLSIAAASIVAKVTRDRLMAKLSQNFPQFSFAVHKGYGTQRHYEELAAHGPTPIHRLSFKGVV